MKEVLLISGFNIQQDSPNALCTREIVNSLAKRKDINITVISDENLENNNDRKRNFFKQLMRVFYWPSTNPDKINQYYRKAIRATNSTEYDYIIAVHKPFEALYAAYKYKRNHPSSKLIIYELDPIANEIDANLGLGRHLFFLTKLAEKRLYKKADHIFHMRCNESQFVNSRYNKYIDKSSYLDFPLVSNCPEESFKCKSIGNQKIKLIYAGLLNSIYRSPIYLIELLNKLNDQISIDVTFYSRGNCKDYLEEECKLNKYIHVSDYISKGELDKEYDDADFMINISNKYSSMLPSKILTYISTGKPIIHISNQENDACIQYLERYDNCVILKESDSIEFNLNKLGEFIYSHYGVIISGEKIYSNFIENTPDFSAKKIEAYLFSESC